MTSLDFGRVALPGGACEGDEWGCAIEYEAASLEDRVLRTLHRDARKRLPPGTRYEIRKDVAVRPGGLMAMAWYRDDRVPSATNTDASREQGPGLVADGSYLLVGQYRTPAAQ